MLITVQKGPCLVSGQVVYALYDGEFPVVPATIFLRHLEANVALSTNTLSAAAYALKTFFEFLERNNVPFWRVTQATIKSYKRFYLGRRDAHGEYVIKRRTALQYLNVIKQFIGYWRGLREDDPLFIDYVSEVNGVRVRDRRRGALSHLSWYSRVPNTLWQIKIPRKQKKPSKKRYKGLSAEQGRKVMDVLSRAEHRTDVETMLYYRNRAIWAYMLMSLERKGEVVRTRLEDLDQRRGMIHLVDRPEDSWLGDLKSGPGEIFVTPNNPYWNFINSWLTEGRWIAEKMLKAKGESDHGMLFCNRSGGPLTQAAIDHLFRWLKEACKFKLFPHITRHTMATLMLDAGVPLEEVQAQLRHANISSAEIYAKVSVQKLRASLKNFWQEFSL
jgi:site-specific recombinase XerD